MAGKVVAQDDDGLAAFEADRAALLFFAQHPIHGRTRGTCEFGELILREREDTVLVQAAQFDKASQQPLLDRQVERFQQQFVLTAQFPGEEPEEYLVDARVLVSKPIELGSRPANTAGEGYATLTTMTDPTAAASR